MSVAMFMLRSIQEFRCASFFSGIVLLTAAVSCLGADPKSEELVRQGNAAFKEKDREKAIALFTQAIAADPSNTVAYYNRGRMHDVQGRKEPALEDYNRLLALSPKHANGLQWRGTLLLRQGKFQEALADFDKHIAIKPDHGEHHWMRGMALYYLGRYSESQKQYLSAHHVATNDVEHAMWHFLCTARVEGPQKARASFLPVANDERIPMMRLKAFYLGEAKAGDVISAAEAGSPKIDELSRRLLYAHYYIGLFHEATGDQKLAQEHISKAGALSLPGELLSDMARLHRDRLDKTPSAHSH